MNRVTGQITPPSTHFRIGETSISPSNDITMDPEIFSDQEPYQMFSHSFANPHQQKPAPLLWQNKAPDQLGSFDSSQGFSPNHAPTTVNEYGNMSILPSSNKRYSQGQDPVLFPPSGNPGHFDKQQKQSVIAIYGTPSLSQHRYSRKRKLKVLPPGFPESPQTTLFIKRQNQQPSDCLSGRALEQGGEVIQTTITSSLGTAKSNSKNQFFSRRKIKTQLRNMKPTNSRSLCNDQLNPPAVNPISLNAMTTQPQSIFNPDGGFQQSPNLPRVAVSSFGHKNPVPNSRYSYLSVKTATAGSHRQNSMLEMDPANFATFSRVPPQTAFNGNLSGSELKQPPASRNSTNIQPIAHLKKFKEFHVKPLDIQSARQMQYANERSMLRRHKDSRSKKPTQRIFGSLNLGTVKNSDAEIRSLQVTGGRDALLARHHQQRVHTGNWELSAGERSSEPSQIRVEIGATSNKGSEKKKQVPGAIQIRQNNLPKKKSLGSLTQTPKVLKKQSRERSKEQKEERTRRVTASNEKQKSPVRTTQEPGSAVSASLRRKDEEDLTSIDSPVKQERPSPSSIKAPQPQKSKFEIMREHKRRIQEARERIKERQRKFKELMNHELKVDKTILDDDDSDSNENKMLRKQAGIFNRYLNKNQQYLKSERKSINNIQKRIANMDRMKPPPTQRYLSINVDQSGKATFINESLNSTINKRALATGKSSNQSQTPRGIDTVHTTEEMTARKIESDQRSTLKAFANDPAQALRRLSVMPTAKKSPRTITDHSLARDRSNQSGQYEIGGVRRRLSKKITTELSPRMVQKRQSREIEIIHEANSSAFSNQQFFPAQHTANADMIFGEHDLLRQSGVRKGGVVFKAASPPLDGYPRAPSPWKDSKGSQERIEPWSKKLENLAATELPTYRLKTVSPDRFKLSKETIKMFGLTKEDLKPPKEQQSNHVFVDYVNLNKEYSAVSNLKEIRLAQSILRSREKQRRAREAHEVLDYCAREDNLSKTRKWDDFRERRVMAIEDFIAVKKRARVLQSLLKLLLMTQAVKAIWAMFVQEQERRRLVHMGTRLSLMLFAKLKRTLTKQGGVQQIIHNRMRYALTFAPNILYDVFREVDLKLVVAQFFLEKKMINELIKKGRTFHKLISHIRRRFKDKTETRNEKVNLLSLYWDRIVRKIQRAVQKNKDTAMNQFVMNMITIRPEVKEAALRYYLERCDQKHCIAFYQWRYMYREESPSCYSSAEQIIENLTKLSAHFNRAIDITRQPSEITRTMGQLSMSDEVKYGLSYQNTKKELKQREFMVMSFWQIGMADPFPDESTVINDEHTLIGNEELSVDKLVYPRYRYIKGQSPLAIYIPSKMIMAKLIRACMGCSSPDELWFNRTE